MDHFDESLGEDERLEDYHVNLSDSPQDVHPIGDIIDDEGDQSPVASSTPRQLCREYQLAMDFVDEIESQPCLSPIPLLRHMRTNANLAGAPISQEPMSGSRDGAGDLGNLIKKDELPGSPSSGSESNFEDAGADILMKEVGEKNQDALDKKEEDSGATSTNLVADVGRPRKSLKRSRPKAEKHKNNATGQFLACMKVRDNLNSSTSGQSGELANQGTEVTAARTDEGLDGKQLTSE